jgi:hypothetical protein
MDSFENPGFSIQAGLRNTLETPVASLPRGCGFEFQCLHCSTGARAGASSGRLTRWNTPLWMRKIRACCSPQSTRFPVTDCACGLCHSPGFIVKKPVREQHRKSQAA